MAHCILGRGARICGESRSATALRPQLKQRFRPEKPWRSYSAAEIHWRQPPGGFRPHQDVAAEFEVPRDIDHWLCMTIWRSLATSSRSRCNNLISPKPPLLSQGVIYSYQMTFKTKRANLNCISLSVIIPASTPKRGIH